jgi:superfamily II DNA or RNA helicase
VTSFVRYVGDQAVPDFEYGYGEALEDRRVVRPVFFPTTNGQMEWTAPDGAVLSATFDDPLAGAQVGQRLRTALSLEGEWLPSVLRAANERLVEVRSEQPDAAGLVIASNVEHARGIAPRSSGPGSGPRRAS